MSTCGTCGSEVPSGARFCPSCGNELEAPLQPSEERKLATVLFADLVGSTALADRQDPERVRLVLDRFYDAMAAEIERTGGTLEEFAGDAVMAVLGAPFALEDHAERALHARPAIGAVAPAFAQPGLLLEPFALRALGIARVDDELLARAQALFEDLRLHWHAAQTDRLLAGV